MYVTHLVTLKILASINIVAINIYCEHVRELLNLSMGCVPRSKIAGSMIMHMLCLTMCVYLVPSGTLIPYPLLQASRLLIT